MATLLCLGTIYVLRKDIRVRGGSENGNFPLLYVMKMTLGAFTNYVYKRRGVGGQKNRIFVNFYTIENVNGGG